VREDLIGPFYFCGLACTAKTFSRCIPQPRPQSPPHNPHSASPADEHLLFPHAPVALPLSGAMPRVSRLWRTRTAENLQLRRRPTAPQSALSPSTPSHGAPCSHSNVPVETQTISLHTLILLPSQGLSLPRTMWLAMPLIRGRCAACDMFDPTTSL
jgi:hypothetical protein